MCNGHVERQCRGGGEQPSELSPCIELISSPACLKLDLSQHFGIVFIRLAFFTLNR